MKNLSALTVLLLSSYVFAQTPAEKLVAEGGLSPTLEKNLRMLTDEIGGRIPGTPAMDRAEQRVVAALAGGKRGRTR